MTSARHRASRRAALALIRRARRLRSGRDARLEEPTAPPAVTITLEYPVRPVPRYGYGQPAHPQLELQIAEGRDRYRETLRSFLPLVEHLAAVEMQPDDPQQPTWHNGWYQGLDAVSLYGFVATTRPARYIEVGSGNSTKWARRAIRDHDLSTHITSIDPQPRAEVDQLCDRVIRTGLEQADLAVFDDLEAGDICFIDGSHRSFMNSDATVTFVELLPRLKPGVLVHVHDIFLPWDYPPQLADWWYSEHYLLACWLLAGGPLDIVLPNFAICLDGDLHRELAPLWDRLLWAATPTNGTGFWFSVR